MRRRTLVALSLGWVFAFAGGCGPAKSTVSGEVTVDGQPLEKGIISFVPADGKGEPATTNVENGKYQVATSPGNKRVQISAPVVSGKRKAYNGPDAPMIDVTEEHLPERYNSKTELTFEVKSGVNEKSWGVEGKPRKPG